MLEVESRKLLSVEPRMSLVGEVTEEVLGG
jgi:hypothetical protein